MCGFGVVDAGGTKGFLFSCQVQLGGMASGKSSVPLKFATGEYFDDHVRIFFGLLLLVNSLNIGKGDVFASVVAYALF